MRTRLLHGPLLLLLYQVAPVPAPSGARDSLGRYRLTLGYGGGQWENESFDCQGNLTSATRVPFTSGGAQLDVWPSRHVRVSGFGGTFRPTPDASSSYVQDYHGPFQGVQVAWEGQHVGVGFGGAHVSGYDNFTSPSVYLRFGDMDGAYLRLDVLQPSPVLSSTGLARAGFGFREGHLRRLSGFVGVGLPPGYNAKALFSGYVRVPVAGHLALHLDGAVGPGEVYSQRGGAVGVRYDFGPAAK